MRHFIAVGFLVCHTISALGAPPTTASQQWIYPGSLDEEDLKVQEELPPPLQKIDRETQNETAKNKLLKAEEKKTDSSEQDE